MYWVEEEHEPVEEERVSASFVLSGNNKPLSTIEET